MLWYSILPIQAHLDYKRRPLKLASILPECSLQNYYNYLFKRILLLSLQAPLYLDAVEL